jgi:hypothetical protein
MLNLEGRILEKERGEVVVGGEGGSQHVGCGGGRRRRSCRRRRFWTGDFNFQLYVSII